MAVVVNPGLDRSGNITAVPMNRFNNDEVINQRVTNDAEVRAQSHKIDNSQTGNENITGNEQAAKVRAERTEQEKMRMLLGFTTSTNAAEDLVSGLWRCASDVMQDLTNSN
ncbi:hypothetical protein QTP70_012270 [Hemibagrus guttatus]|uniref:Uncharacterized protein n=1 Tax=Hemibagrus guttatus TaxID=175788 RepID=A0AAE0R3T8_9TELE|nr:hypothetical protein QTP70_012270 [Hemibagrus guttatus]